MSVVLSRPITVWKEKVVAFLAAALLGALWCLVNKKREKTTQTVNYGVEPNPHAITENVQRQELSRVLNHWLTHYHRRNADTEI